MPIQSTQASPAVWAFNQAENACAIQKDDGKAMVAAKVVGRLSFVAVTVAAAAQTVVFALLTVLSAGQVNYFREGTKLAARATVASFKAIAGYKTETPVAPTKFEQVKAFVAYYANKAAESTPVKGYVVPAAKAVGNTLLNHKKKVIAAAALYVAHRYGLDCYVGSTVSNLYAGAKGIGFNLTPTSIYENVFNNRVVVAISDYVTTPVSTFVSQKVCGA